MSPDYPLIRRNLDLKGSNNSRSSTKFFFGPIRNQDDRPGFWLAGLFSTLCNRWTALNETWQEANTQRHLPSLCISGRSENKDGLPGLWLAETFLTSPMQALNGILWNLIESSLCSLIGSYLIGSKFLHFELCNLIGSTFVYFETW